jgi:hypothetical protein
MARSNKEREEMTERRKAVFGIYADKYRHLHGTEALDVPPAMGEQAMGERHLRKFGAPPA